VKSAITCIKVSETIYQTVTACGVIGVESDGMFTKGIDMNLGGLDVSG